MTSEKYSAKLGRFTLDIRTITRDIRGVEDLIKEAVEKDWAEQRYIKYKLRIFPFPDAWDIAEWDKFLIERYPPMYTHPQKTCSDCPLGPCPLEKTKGKCGLDLEAYQAKLSLRIACRGCLSQMMDSRDLLNYAIKIHGKEKAVSLGKSLDKGDFFSIRGITGLDPQNLGDLDRVQTYTEEQLVRLLTASIIGVGNAADFEELTFHAGSLLFVTQNVAEMIKASAFTFTNAGDQPISELYNYPRANRQTGLGSVDRTKPVLLFVGDSFLPGWATVSLLREKGLVEKIEVCGIGPAADDGIRFYPPYRNLGPMMQARKIIRSGIADVIVAGTTCIPLDVLKEAQRVESKVIWTGREQSWGLVDRIDDPEEAIVRDFVAGIPAAWIRDPEKAAAVALEVVQQIKRKGNYILSDEKVKEEAGKCREDCDLCFTLCPNSLLLNKAVKAAKVEGAKALSEVERGCYLCYKCEESCPAGIALTDLLVAAQGLRMPKDVAVMRAGRGTGMAHESLAFAFTLLNVSTIALIFGCGDAPIDDIAWMANELVSWSGIVWVGGCAGVQAARYFDEDNKKHIFQLYPAETLPRNLVNCGACSAIHHAADQFMKWARAGNYISVYGNLAESADCMHWVWYPSAIIWGALPERMYTVAAALARMSIPVIVGPASAFGWKRFLISDDWDYRKWWGIDILRHKKKHTEPQRKHMIIPVETKEEAIVMLAGTQFYASGVSGINSYKLEFYVENAERFWGEWPADWYKHIRGPMEFSIRHRARMMKRLADEYGWETFRTIVLRAKHPDGRLLTWEEFRDEYSSSTGDLLTVLPHRVREQYLEIEGGEK